MKFDFIRKDLLHYIKNEIKPMYKNFDKAHSTSHFNFVTNNCIEYGKELQKQGQDIDLEIAYVVGALHDIGISRGRENHAKSSGDMVRKDINLRQFYDDNIIEMLAQSVEDHSSHLAYEPRNIYGKIVADADRNNTMYLVFSRPTKYSIKNEKHLTRDEHIDKVYNFVQDKFGKNGYVKYWLNIPQTTKEQLRVWQLLDDEKSCKAYIGGIYDEIKKGKK